MQPCVDYAPKGLCSVSQVNLISTAASGALAVVTMLTTPIASRGKFYRDSVLESDLFIFFSEVDGSELWKVQRKCGKSSEIKQFCELPLGRDISFTSIY